MSRLAAFGLTLVACLSVVRASADDAPFPSAAAADVGIDASALERLKTRAAKAGSDAVVIVKDGKLVADWDFGKPRGPIEAMSATKSIVNLAIGRLIDQGKIRSLDQPVADFYREWRQGRKRQITVHHLLNHTSGLQDQPQAMEIYDSPDFVQFALAAEMSADPGARFFYSNKAVNLLAGIVQKASGRPMDEYLREQIFAPLGINDFAWSKDGAGNPQGMAGLQIRAIDFARIGQMMLDGGKWKGHPVVSEEWVRLSTAQPGQPHESSCGLLWWLVRRGGDVFEIDDAMIADFKEAGLTEGSVKKLEALKGNRYDMEGVWEALRPVLHRDEVVSRKLMELDERLKKTGRPRPRRVDSGPIEGYAARGYLGQFLVVIPRLRLVAVRQVRGPRNDEHKSDDFFEFERMVQELVPRLPGRSS
jgi:CubicO group peptidase (beta-lactamase class C family)